MIQQFNTSGTIWIILVLESTTILIVAKLVIVYSYMLSNL